MWYNFIPVQWNTEMGSPVPWPFLQCHSLCPFSAVLSKGPKVQQNITHNNKVIFKIHTKMFRYCHTVACISNVWDLIKCKEKILQSNFKRKCKALLSVKILLIVCSWSKETTVLQYILAQKSENLVLYAKHKKKKSIFLLLALCLISWLLFWLVGGLFVCFTGLGFLVFLNF